MLRILLRTTGFGGATDALDANNEVELALEHPLIEKKQGAKGLVLSRGSHGAVNGEVAKKGGDL